MFNKNNNVRNILLILQIGSLNDFYLFEHQHVHKRSIYIDEKYHSRLKSDPQVIISENLYETCMNIVRA